ncbi:glycosyltransferase family 2 protein [Pararcticibacter amylolyticus]|uniref:Glycosyltransferase 2-like domain-containing protein n=1 Tax=Pararcticibacter amylolyticus TaxID=2173175 RepID=A0A2U2PFM3_9SPHI|nr:glycosyltransferase family A protein [Pararcticibacter amylolyticus]PWG80207.1 hypothetical protein DDR33_13520 [Pararcticibacter amylolyticus]
MESNEPLISCICITNRRPLLLQRAIACFESQTYPNRELVVSYPADDEQTRDLMEKIAQISDINLVLIERAETERLGMARNNAIRYANGKYVCMWDDDDWYHQDRIRLQYETLKDSPFKACILFNILLFDALSAEAFLSPFHLWEGTLLSEKEVLMDQMYLDVNKGEDTAVVFNLHKNNLLYHLNDQSFLYVYIYHGENTWQESHFNSYFIQSQPLGKDVSKQVVDLTNLEPYRLS